MEHDGCKGCRYEREKEDSVHCQGCKQNAVDKYVKRTNADRIREMTNEELAEFLCDKSDCYEHRCHMYKECANGDKKEWLESECDAEC